jgi:HAMP domain-containing protein
MPSETEAPPKALFDHCQNAYKAMLSQAKVVVDPSSMEEEPIQLVVYEGFLTHLITQELSLSVPYYTSVRKALINMGCIKQLRRGGGTSPSQWELITEPTLDAFTAQEPKKKPAQTKQAFLQEQIDSMNTRISELETTVEELVTAWAQFFGAQEVKDS